LFLKFHHACFYRWFFIQAAERSQRELADAAERARRAAEDEERRRVAAERAATEQRVATEAAIEHAKRQALIEQFESVTGCSDAVKSGRFLDSFNQNLEVR
jgi:hypothetical protein